MISRSDHTDQSRDSGRHTAYNNCGLRSTSERCISIGNDDFAQRRALFEQQTNNGNGSSTSARWSSPRRKLKPGGFLPTVPPSPTPPEPVPSSARAAVDVPRNGISSTPLTKSQSSTPLTKNQSSTPLTKSQSSTPLTKSQSSAPFLKSQSSAPLIKSETSTTPLIKSESRSNHELRSTKISEFQKAPIRRNYSAESRSSHARSEQAAGRDDSGHSGHSGHSKRSFLRATSSKVKDIFKSSKLDKRKGRRKSRDNHLSASSSDDDSARSGKSGRSVKSGKMGAGAWQDRVFKVDSSASESSHKSSHSTSCSASIDSLQINLQVKLDYDPRNSSFSSYGSSIDSSRRSRWSGCESLGDIKPEESSNKQGPGLLDARPKKPQRQRSSTADRQPQPHQQKAPQKPTRKASTNAVLASTNAVSNAVLSVSSSSTCSTLSMGDPTIIKIKPNMTKKGISKSQRKALAAEAKKLEPTLEEGGSFVPPTYIIIKPKSQYSSNPSRIVEV